MMIIKISHDIVLCVIKNITVLYTVYIVVCQSDKSFVEQFRSFLLASSSATGLIRIIEYTKEAISAVQFERETLTFIPHSSNKTL